MKWILILILAVGCREPMTNEEIIAQMKLCESGGMEGHQYAEGFGWETVRVECRPIRKCEPRK